MFKFDKIDLQRIATAAVGAFVLTVVSVGAAVGPARAVEMDRSVAIEARA
jgi:energy-converting hydrogenase Eha subunit E